MLEKIKVETVGLLGSLLLRGINRTLRWESVGLDGSERYWASGAPGILAFWHGRQLLMPWIYFRHRRDRSSPGLCALISHHRDGRFVASVMRYLGIHSVAGSSSSGGFRAFRSLMRAHQDNYHRAITPDGPKGPKGKLKDGVILLAQRTGAEIHPAAYAAERCWIFRSWDGMVLPKPFSRAVLVKGMPIRIPPDAGSEELEQITAAVERTINAATEAADSYFVRNR